MHNVKLTALNCLKKKTKKNLIVNEWDHTYLAYYHGKHSFQASNKCLRTEKKIMNKNIKKLIYNIITLMTLF